MKDSTCRKCKYAQIFNIGDVETCCCVLVSVITKPDEENDCSCFNKDLSEYKICYNCEFYLGGSDWGLFCSHKDHYNHLGKFSDRACKHFKRKLVEKE